MPKNTPRPNDSVDYRERLRHTTTNKEAAEFATEFADGKELASIKEKNARRDNSNKNSLFGNNE